MSSLQWLQLSSRAEQDASHNDSTSTTVAIVTGVIGGVALCAAIVLFCYTFVRKRRQRLDELESFRDEEKGGAKYLKFEGIPPPPAAYRKLGSRTDLVLHLDEKNGSLLSSVPALTISPPSSEDSPPVAKKWKQKRVPVPRLSAVPPSPGSRRSRTRSWLARLPPSPRFSRRGNRASQKSAVSAPTSPVPPLPSFIPPRPLPDLPASEKPTLRLVIP